MRVRMCVCVCESVCVCVCACVCCFQCRGSAVAVWNVIESNMLVHVCVCPRRLCGVSRGRAFVREPLVLPRHSLVHCLSHPFFFIFGHRPFVIHVSFSKGPTLFNATSSYVIRSVVQKIVWSATSLTLYS